MAANIGHGVIVMFAEPVLNTKGCACIYEKGLFRIDPRSWA